MKPILKTLIYSALVALVPSLANAQILANSFSASNYTGNAVANSGVANSAGTALPLYASDGSSVQVSSGLNSYFANGNTITSTAFYDTAQSASGGFTTSFTFSDTPGGGTGNADGASFIIQNTGLTAIGGNQQGLGYSGIANSLGLGIQTYSGNTVGLELGENGSFSGLTAFTGGVNLSSPIDFTLAYDGAKSLTVNYSQGSSGVQTQTFTLANTLAADLGGQTGYVGFGGAIGGNAQNSTFSNFTFTPVAAPEPGQLAYMAVGLLTLASVMHLRRKKVS